MAAAGTGNGFGAMPGKYANLAGKRVLVTGGSQGIGKAIALAFAQNGAKVAVAARTKAKLDKVVQEMGDGCSVVLDLTRLEDCKRAVKEAIETLGGLDVVVNNGAPFSDEMWRDTDTPAAFESAFQLHVTSAVVVIQAALPELKANKGSVINISSSGAVIPIPEMSSYCTVKAALDHMTRVYALKYAKDGVRFNSVRSGATLTEAVEQFAQSQGKELSEMVAHLGSTQALGRMATPQEQAAIVAFLASDAASIVTGATIDADCGAQLGYWFNLTHKPDEGV